MPPLLQCSFVPMTMGYAALIAGWRYPAEYKFYDWVNDPDDLAELLDAARWPGCYHAVVAKDGALLGFLQTIAGGNSVEIGLGLRPDLTGFGYGRGFLDACLCFVTDRFAAERFTLIVASFNRRAITVYERAGFRVTGEFMQRTNGDEYKFVRMERNRLDRGSGLVQPTDE